MKNPSYSRVALDRFRWLVSSHSQNPTLCNRINTIMDKCGLFSEITHILLRLVDELNFCLSQVTGTAASETKSDEGIDFEDEGERHHDLIQKLLLTMEALIKAGKTPVMVLDGIDKVKRESQLGKVNKPHFEKKKLK